MTENGAMRRDLKSDAARLLLAASRERFSVAAADLLLPEQARLSEWQRVTAATLLSRLVQSIEDLLRGALAEALAEEEGAAAALASAHVAIAAPILERAQMLRDPDLFTILVRRVEEHRYWQAHVGTGAEAYLATLVRDPDEAVAADAMDVLIASGRRFDRFQDPILGRAELPAEVQHRLVWLIAAALRHYLVQRHGLGAGAVDVAIEEAARALIDGYDEGEGLEAQALRLARRLHAAGRLEGPDLARMLEEGGLVPFIAGLSVRSGLDQAATWEVLSDPRGRGPALLLRAAGLGRNEAAAILLLLNSRGQLFSGPEGDATAAQLELFGAVDDAGAQAVLRLWRADPAYRAAVARLSTRARSVSEAA